MRRLLLAFLLLLLAGCGAGPGPDVLQQDVKARLEQALPAGSVTLVSFDRRGSQKDTKAPEGETRRIVYYDLALKVERDMDFGAWDAPGVAGLISALGAGPKGITGIQSGGNKAGDVVRAHGTALYKREGDRWVAAAPGGYRPTEAPAYATNAALGPAALLDQMRKVIERVPKDTAAAHTAVIQEELQVAYATINARLARASNGYAIAAGPENGQYLRFAQAMRSTRNAPVMALVTLGGEENLELLRAGKVDLALAQGDAALAAYLGTGPFAANGPAPTLRAVGSLYPEPVHVLVRGDLPANSVAELRGRRVAIGQPGSASRTTALRVLAAHGLGPNDIKPLDLSLANALVGMRERQVDAAIQVIGVPADTIRDALAAFPLRLLPLSERAITTLSASKTGLFPHTVAAASYPTQARPVRTVATAALLLVGTGLSDSEVNTLTRLVYEKGQDLAARGSAQALQVSLATAQQGLTVPLHVEAARVLLPTAVAPPRTASAAAATPAAPAPPAAALPASAASAAR